MDIVVPGPLNDKTRHCLTDVPPRYCHHVPTEPLRCVGALIVDEGARRIFCQWRSPDRRTFPNAWDPVGGYVEPGMEIGNVLRTISA